MTRDRQQRIFRQRNESTERPPRIVPLLRSSHLLRALASPTRLRILALLECHELCVCQLTTVLGVAASTVSAHLSQLHRERLLTRRKEGRWVNYALAEDDAAAHLLPPILDGLREDETIRGDLATLERVLRLDREELAGSPEVQEQVRSGVPSKEIEHRSGTVGG